MANFSDSIADTAREQLVAEGGALALRAQAIDPDDPSVYTALSVYAALGGDARSALRYAERRVELQPRSPWSYNDLSVHYRYDFQPAKAIEMLDKALALYPKGGDALFANLAANYFMLGNYEAAMTWALKAVDLNTGLSGPYAIVAMVYSEAGEASKAQAAAAEVRRRFPGLKPPYPTEPNTSEAYRRWVQATYLPVWRKAGLP